MASYDKADLDAAVVEARARRATGQGSVVDVARQYEIPPTTLYGHVANPDMGTGQGGGTALSAEAESALLDWISAQSNTSTAEIRRKAAELEKLEAEQAGRAEHWPDGACFCFS